MNVMFVMMGIFMALAMLLTCEIHYLIYKNYEKTSVIAITGLAMALLIMTVGIFIL